MKYLLVGLVLVLTGCELGDRPENPKRKEFGKLKHEIFKECMSLSSANVRQGDDDVSDIVEACRSYADNSARNQLDY